MYLDYFGFDEPPFSITPDPNFVFLSHKHQESLAHLVYGISRGGGAGFVQLTGEVGTGKTTISRLLLEQIPENTNIALILNPTITPTELLENICKELKVSIRGIKGKLNRMVDKLNDYLIKSWSKGENTVVIIDEAQNLPRDTLEQLRLLTNLETDKQKLLQIILIGQPELRATMRRDDLRQLAQRVTARYHLMPLDGDETYDYLLHRIKIAGGSKDIISTSVAKQIYKLTQGVPRLINILTDRALLAAYSDNSEIITKKHLQKAAIEVLPEKHTSKSSHSTPLLLLIIVALVLIIYIYYNSINKSKSEAALDGQLAQRTVTTENETVLSKPTAQQAWRQLFKVWDAENDKNWHKLTCPQSTDSGMACLRRQGNLKQIRKINHPILLQLEDDSLITLTKLNPRKIGLLDNTNTLIFKSKQWLEQQWLGTYFIIWPMPAELLIELEPKALSKWSLEMANTIANDRISARDLNKWIKAFQKEQGLLADGIIGSETQMALSLMAYNGPILTQK